MIVTKFPPRHCFVPRGTLLRVATSPWHSRCNRHCYYKQVLNKASFRGSSLRFRQYSADPCEYSAVKEHDELLSSIESCWNATGFTITLDHKERVDEILQGVCSPAPQSYFVLERAVHIFFDNQKRVPASIEGLEQVFSKYSYLLKCGFQFVIDTSFIEDPCWSVVPTDLEPRVGWRAVNRTNVTTENESALEIAHKALTMATLASEKGIGLDEATLEAFASQAKHRLKQTLGTDIRGRSSADAAFTFALAGVQDPDLYLTLNDVCRMELLRVGSRTSVKPQHILQVVEKLAAAGVKQGQYSIDRDVYRAASGCLSRKSEKQYTQVVETLKNGGFDLLNPRPLLWLWRFSSRQTKAKVPAQDTSNTCSEEEEDDIILHSVASIQSPPSHSWLEKLADPTRPLVVDVGCGMGVSLLGLSTLKSHGQLESFTNNELLNIDWSECNFVGVDLSHLAIGFAQGISHRWNLESKVQFVCQSGQELLEEIAERYPGHVALVLIQFPTPFRLQAKKVDGNSQLPSDPSSGFMVTQALLQSAARLVEGAPSGQILIQSNCEDVAVTMKDMAIETAGLECIPVPNPVRQARENLECGRIPLRTEEWIRQGGKRAVGREWSRDSLLPPRGATETEVACHMQETPIHRCLLKPR